MKPLRNRSSASSIFVDSGGAVRGLDNSASESLRALLYPEAIAVIGASSSPHKPGGRRWISILEAAGKTRAYPVNTNGGMLNGCEVLESLSQLPRKVDLAVILVPAKSVLPVVEQCAEQGIRTAVIVSAGFGETGEAGRVLEKKLVSHFRANGGRILGPNSAGIFSAAGGVNALGWNPPAGNIGLITQSGNVAHTFARLARTRRVGFSSIIPLGNAADVKLSELTELLISDENSKSILIYCEGFSPDDGRKLVEIARSAGGKKGVVIVKPGRSQAGTRAVQSHTGSVAGDDAVLDAALREAGIIRANELEEAFDIAVAMSQGKKLRTRAIAVLSDGGGHATVVADAGGRLGLSLAEFSEETLGKLKNALPPLCGIKNPVDFAGSAESDPALVATAIDLCLSDSNVSGAIFAGGFGGYYLFAKTPESQNAISEIEQAAAQRISHQVLSSEKPVLIHSEVADTDLPPLAPFRKANIPLFLNLESTAKAMAALIDNEVVPEIKVSREIDANGRSGRVLLETEARQRLRDHNIAPLAFRSIAQKQEAEAAFDEFGPAVAMKLMSYKAPHKSDVGGVILDVGDRKSCVSAFERLMTLGKTLGDDHPSILVTPMVSSGLELFIGAKRDMHFGPVVLFGTGGVLVELMRDVACRLAPFDRSAAATLIAGTKISTVLRGYRGSKPQDVAPLEELLIRVSEFITSETDVLELDLNPVILNENGLHLVDARLILR